MQETNEVNITHSTGIATNALNTNAIFSNLPKQPSLDVKSAMLNRVTTNDHFNDEGENAAAEPGKVEPGGNINNISEIGMVAISNNNNNNNNNNNIVSLDETKNKKDTTKNGINGLFAQQLGDQLLAQQLDADDLILEMAHDKEMEKKGNNNVKNTGSIDSEPDVYDDANELQHGNRNAANNDNDIIPPAAFTIGGPLEGA